MTTTIAQVGVRGFGRIHMERIDRLAGMGRIELVATADPGGPLEDRDVAWYPSLTELLERHSPDIVSLATPIGTHSALATEAMRAGADVFLEKPPFASLAEFWQVLRAIKETGKQVQIGFQSLGSEGVARLRGLVADGTLGDIVGINARGAWLRQRAYYARAPWAGRRTLDGKRIADGVVTNPLAHSLATALVVAGVTDIDDIASVTTEMYHVHDIEADDTSFVRIELVDGPPVCAALTLVAPDQGTAMVTVVGTRGTATYEYTDDVLHLQVDGVTTHETFARTDLLENFVDHLEGGAEALVPLQDTIGFMCVLEATQDRPAPLPIPDRYVTWHGEGLEGYPILKDVEYWMDQALAQQNGFAAAGAPWGDPDAVAVWRPRTALTHLEIDGRVVAEYADGSDINPTSSPRPYLHPIRTLAGVTISDSHPADHDWHCGLSFTMQDVNGVNFWGGRTYVRDRGYQWLGDQGAITHVAFGEQGPGHLTETLRWAGPIVEPLEQPIAPVELTEQRRLEWRRAGEQAWILDADLSLTSPTGAEVTLGSPGTNGRDTGYGGWQLRLRPTENIRVWGPEGEGLDAVFGATGPWVAWTSEFDGKPVTLVLAHHDAEAAASDRWFVRNGDFSGIGTSLAWSEVVSVPLRRRYRLIVADGTLAGAELEALLPTLS